MEIHEFSLIFQPPKFYAGLTPAEDRLQGRRQARQQSNDEHDSTAAWRYSIGGSAGGWGLGDLFIMARIENTDFATSLRHYHAAVYCVPDDTFLPRTLGASLNYDRTQRWVKTSRCPVRPRTDCRRGCLPEGLPGDGGLSFPQQPTFLRSNAASKGFVGEVRPGLPCVQSPMHTRHDARLRSLLGPPPRHQ